MADTKISALSSGGAALSTDQFPIARSGANYALTAQAVSNLTVSNLTNGVTTFTPSITFGGGSTGITYTQQTGSWVKVGNITTIEIVIFLSNKGSSTGAMQIVGLPISFPSATGEFAVGSIRAGFMTGLGGAMGVSGSNGTSNLDVYQWSATGQTTVFDTNVTNTSTLFVSLTCIV